MGESFAAYLSGHGLSTEVGVIAREEVEQYLADMRDRGLLAATVAKHSRSLHRWHTGICPARSLLRGKGAVGIRLALELRP